MHPDPLLIPCDAGHPSRDTPHRMAVAVGFEPTVELPPHTLSRRAPLAARTRHRRRGYTHQSGVLSTTLAVEELPNEGAALIGEDPADNFWPVCEASIAQQIPHGACGTVGVIPCAEDDPVDAGGLDGTGTHGARLEGDGDGATGEPPTAQHIGGATQRDYLGMCGGVSGGFTFINSLGDNDTVGIENDRADGYILTSVRGRCETKCSLYSRYIRGTLHKRITGFSGEVN